MNLLNRSVCEGKQIKQFVCPLWTLYGNSCKAQSLVSFFWSGHNWVTSASVSQSLPACASITDYQLAIPRWWLSSSCLFQHIYFIRAAQTQERARFPHLLMQHYKRLQWTKQRQWCILRNPRFSWYENPIFPLDEPNEIKNN